MADYTLACNIQGTQYIPCPDAFNDCATSTQCRAHTCPANSCPAPLPNSHLVSDNCTNIIGITCRRCQLNLCIPTGTCIGSGNCEYDCDVGYVWDGIACVLAPALNVESGQSYLCVLAASVLAKLKRRRKKRKAYIVIMT